MNLIRPFVIGASLLIGTFCFLPEAPLAEADNWTTEASQEHAPQSPENRIIKWCNEDDSHVRYASANLKIKGYVPCGKLSVSATCDATGNRMISKDNERPHGHLDCSVGPRIFIMRHSEGDIIDTSAVPEDGEEIKPLSYQEKKALKEEMEQASKSQRNNPGQQLQNLVENMIKTMLSSNPRKQNSRQQRKAKKQVDEALKSMDPHTREALQKFLDIKHWEKVFNTR